MVNPFGEESDSVVVWRERYKAKEFEVQTLQLRVGELKGLYDKSIEDYQTQAQELITVQTELFSTREELSRISTILREKQSSLDNLEQSLETESIASLKSENLKYREEIEDLQSQLARGGGQTDSSSDLSNAITPLMLKVYDPGTTRFDDAFDKFVSAVSINGDVFQKIIASVIKRGGTSSLENAKSSVNGEEFDKALDYLIENEILKLVDSKLMIVTSDTLVSSDTNWDEMDISSVLI